MSQSCTREDGVIDLRVKNSTNGTISRLEVHHFEYSIWTGTLTSNEEIDLEFEPLFELTEVGIRSLAWCSGRADNAP